MPSTPSLKEQILDYWNALGSEALRKDRKALIRAMAEKFHMAPQLIEKELAEWEAGKSVENDETLPPPHTL